MCIDPEKTFFADLALRNAEWQSEEERQQYLETVRNVYKPILAHREKRRQKAVYGRVGLLHSFLHLFVIVQ